MISSLTTSDMILSSNPSSVNLGGDSSYVHLDEYIERNSLGGDSSGFPLDVWTHDYLAFYHCYLETRVDPEGYPREQNCE